MPRDESRSEAAPSARYGLSKEEEEEEATRGAVGERRRRWVPFRASIFIPDPVATKYVGPKIRGAARRSKRRRYAPNDQYSEIYDTADARDTTAAVLAVKAS